MVLWASLAGSSAQGLPRVCLGLGSHLKAQVGQDCLLSSLSCPVQESAPQWLLAGGRYQEGGDPWGPRARLPIPVCDVENWP